jgi:hydroxysqualene dehydroxylase
VAGVENLGFGVNEKSVARDQPRVAIIGAGYAGAAAAVRLTAANIRVSIFESAKVAGGRARTVTYQGHALDNGQHMLIGAYSSLLGLLDTVGVGEAGLIRLPMQMHLHPDFRLRTPALPAPLHLAWGLLTAEGLTWGDRIATMRLSGLVQKKTLPVKLQQATVSQLLTETGQTPTLIRNLWLPLCIAALNTPIETASAAVFANVLRDALFQQRRHSDFLLPRVGLTELFPQPALDWVRTHGGDVHLGSRVRRIDGSQGVFHLATGDASRDATSFDAVICAVGPHQLSDVDGDAAAALPAQRPHRFEPICTVYLAYDQPVPLPAIMVGRQTGLVQWFFDRGSLGGEPGLIAAVISASGPHEHFDQMRLAEEAHRELQELTGPLRAPVWSKVITERFATFACTPDVARPPVRTPLPGLYIAGDYTEGPYPATLESAVRSGESAATALQAHLRSRREP